MKTRDILIAVGVFVAARLALTFVNMYKLGKQIQLTTGKPVGVVDTARAVFNGYLQVPQALFSFSAIRTELKMLTTPPSTDYSSKTVTSQIPDLLRADAAPYEPPRWY